LALRNPAAAAAAIPYSMMASTSSSRMIRYSSSSIFTSEPEYLPKRILSPAFPHRDHLALLGLFLGGVRDDDAALLLLLLLQPLDKDAVMQRTNLHGQLASC